MLDTSKRVLLDVIGNLVYANNVFAPIVESSENINMAISVDEYLALISTVNNEIRKFQFKIDALKTKIETEKTRNNNLQRWQVYSEEKHNG